MVTPESERRQMISAIIASLGAMVIGTTIGWSSSAEIMLSKNYPIDEETMKDLGCDLCKGAILGALFAGVLTRWIGYRGSMIMFELITFCSWMFLTYSKNSLHGSKWFQGVGVGALSTVIPPYIGEISLPHIRGKLIALFQVFIAAGILFAYALGSVADYTQLNFMCAVLTVVHVVAAVFSMPESPYFLLRTDKDDRAKEELTKLRVGEDPANVESELANIKNGIEAHRTMSIFNIVNYKSLGISVGCMIFQQLVGINVYLFFMHHYFRQEGVYNSFNPTILVGIVQLIVTILAMAIVDSAGRRYLLKVSIVLTSLCLIFLQSLIYIMHDDDLEKWTLFIFLVLLVSAFSLGFGLVPWIVMGEIFSTEFKPYGTSIATAFNWIFMLQELNDTYRQSPKNDSATDLYMILCFFGAMYVASFVPETKNKTLAQIQSNLAGSGG